MSESHRRACFPSTEWGHIARAGDPADPAAGAALEVLCRDYWYPLYALARRRGLGREDAGDLVQGFLADLIERRDLARVDPSRGRFRSFLWTAFVHYMSHQRHRDRAAKRGGGRRIISIDLREAEGRLGLEPSHEETAERLFERRWAMQLLGHVLARLERETGQSELFRRLKPLLEGDDLAESYREIGEATGVSEGNVKAAAHRLRRRYRQLLREEVARTVADAADVDSEITDLLAALA